MINLFEMLKKHETSLTKGFENKPYWDPNKTEQFEKNVMGPDGNYYDQEALYEYIKESDRKRLLRFG